MTRVWSAREQRDRHCSICPPFPTLGRTQVRDLGRTGDDLPTLPRHHQERIDEGTRRCECHGPLGEERIHCVFRRCEDNAGCIMKSTAAVVLPSQIAR
jgi:hypothetical protein